MKNIDPALDQHLSGTVTTLCRCWRLQRRDGQVFGFTDHDRNISFGGVLYEAGSGLSAGEIEQRAGLNADSQQVSGALVSGRITEADIRADRYDGARIESFLVNWSDPQERLLERISTLGEIIREDGHFRAELRGAAAALDQTTGRRFSRVCDADLGDTHCGINLQLALWTAIGAVSEVIDDLNLRVSGIDGFPVNHFTGGRMALASGANSGAVLGISGHFPGVGGSVLSLWKLPAFPVSQGDVFSITAGCDKRFSTCRDRFANSRNFRGFPHIPGNDFALGYATSFDDFDGGALVP